MRNRTLLLGLVMFIAAGCEAKEEADGDGVDIEAAPVQIQPDTQSVIVPDVNIGTDTTAAPDTTNR